jgi:hypothetical protein
MSMGQKISEEKNEAEDVMAPSYVSMWKRRLHGGVWGRSKSGRWPRLSRAAEVWNS